MTSDSEPTCPLTCEDSGCPVVPLLHAILDKVEESLQTLEGMEAKGSSKTTHCRLHVNRLVFALQIECPDKIWTSDDFAKEIGCTGAAVRKTKAWREYQERLENMKCRVLQQKGYKGHRTEDSDAEEGGDFGGENRRLVAEVFTGK